MAKQVGVIRIKGTLDGINFYGDNARRAGGGFNGKRIKKDSNFERVRENYTEFGASSRVKRFFRNSLLPFLSIRKDPTLHSRMMSMMVQVARSDRINKRGERSVYFGLQSPSGRKIFTDFVFTPDCVVSKVLGASIHFDFTENTFSISSISGKDVDFPSGGTHLALTPGLLHFDFETLDYELVTAPPVYLAQDDSFEGQNFTISEPSKPGVAIAVAGLKFYQEISGVYYLLRDSRAVGLELVGLELGELESSDS